jgi:nucleoside-diphosphate-sugar epimerase
VARVLIVGCGCRGRELAAALVGDGYAVRGTTRDPASIAAIEATGAEGVVGDPDQLSTLLPHIEGVSAVCWLMATAAGEPEKLAALHGPGLQSLLGTLVDTPVRGFVYEGAGAALVRTASRTFRIPVEVLEEEPARHERWLEAARTAVPRVLERP